MVYHVSTADELVQIIKKEEADKVIYLSEGIYEIESTLELNGSVKIKGVKGKTVLNGSCRVFFDDSNIGEDGIVSLDLEKAGIRDLGRFGLGPYNDFWRAAIPKPHMENEGPSLQLYYGEKEMPLSRYPEKGEIWIAEARGETPVYKYGTKKICGCKEGVFRPEDTTVFDQEDSENLQELLVTGYWFWDWATQKHLIEFYDRETKTLSLQKPYHGYGYRADPEDKIGGCFFVLNARSALRNPGDWCINRREKKVYFYPYPGQEYVDISVCENIFMAKNRNNISVEGISFRNLRRSAVWLEDCADVLVEDCDIANCGSWAIVADRCKDTVIRGCHITNTGAGGIAVSGGDRNRLEDSGILVEKNEIHDISYWVRTYMPAIEINGVGICVRANKIWDVPHFAMDLQGNNNIIECNEICNACFESSDAGAIYGGYDCTCLGNIIRYNYIHDIVGMNGNGCAIIYFDDGFCGAEVYGNTFANSPGVGVVIGGGREINVHDNMFFECGLSLHVDRRGTGWAKGMIPVLISRIKNLDYQSDIWRKAYPRLEKYPEDEPEIPKYNSFIRNTVIGGKNMIFESMEDFGTGVQIAGNTHIKTKDEYHSYWHNPGFNMISGDDGK